MPERAALLILGRLPDALCLRVLRLIGISVVGVGQKRIPIAVATAAGGHRLAILQGGKTAATHAGSDVLAAILTRAGCGRRRHRDKRQREQRRGARDRIFQKLFHLVPLCLL